MASILGGQSKRTLDGLNPDKFASWISKYSYPDEERFWQAVSPFVTPSSLSMGDNMELSLAKWGYNKTSFRDNLREWLSDCSFSNNQSIKDNANKFLDNMGGLTFLKRFDKNQGTNNANFSIGSATATITASRGTSNPATYIDSDGVIISRTTSNTGRYTQGFYDSTGFVSRPGLIVEGASTNLNPYSISTAETAGKLDNWNPATGGTIGGTPTWSTVTPSIYPTAKAQRVRYTGIASDAGRLHLNLVTVAVTAGTTYTGSIFLRSQNGSGAQVAISIQELDGTATNILQNITVTSSWARYQIQRTMGAGVTQARLTVGFVNGTPIVEGVVVDLEGACPQIEALPFASTFIPTTTAALTRNAETLTYPISGNRTAATESIFVKMTAPYNYASGTGFVGVISDVDGFRRRLQHDITNNETIFYPSDSAGTLVSWNNSDLVINQSYVHAFTCSETGSENAAIYRDGVVDATSPTDFTSGTFGANFYVGCRNNSSQYLYGIISSLAIFSDAKSAADVAAISTLMAAG